MFFIRKSVWPYAAGALVLWTFIVVHFAATSVDLQPLSFAPRPRGVQVLRDVISERHNVPREVSVAEPEKIEIVDGFANPNKLPKLPRLGPPSFFDILAPPYYGKSPVDGSRNYVPGSEARKQCSQAFQVQVPSKEDMESMPHQVKRHIYEMHGGASLMKLDEPLCSYGPDEYTDSLVSENIFAAYEFHDVCVTMNIDSSKKVQRGLIYFDPANHHKMRCVPCPNPIERQRWSDHACGLMWSHQINARSLSDYSKCYSNNEGFIKSIGQRQDPGSTIKGGIFYQDTVLLLSYANKNPGHQMFDSLFTLVPLVVASSHPPRVIIHQSPSCPDTEWFCAILRRVGLIRDEILLPVHEGYVPCFKTLVVPKWGLSRIVAYPGNTLRTFRTRLQQAFNLKSSIDKQLLVYAHDTKSEEVQQHRRIWTNMQSSVATSHVLDHYSIRVVDDFAKLSVEEQARAFYESDVIVMPHGGQFGNAIFARDGTRMIEMVCNGYSHLGMTHGTNELFGYVPRALQFVHLIVVPCSCSEKGDLDSNFAIGPTSVKRAIDLAATLPPGTHHAHKLDNTDGPKCFGNDA